MSPMHCVATWHMHSVHAHSRRLAPAMFYICLINLNHILWIKGGIWDKGLNHHSVLHLSLGRFTMDNLSYVCMYVCLGSGPVPCTLGPTYAG